MKEIDYEKIVSMNYRCVLLLGYVRGILDKYYNFLDLPESCIEHAQHKWVIESIENIIYPDKPLPPMPTTYDK